jgi:hypothetical protein
VTDFTKPEIHFLRIEGILQEINLTSAKSIFGLKSSLDLDLKKNPVYAWQIVDLDDFLRGNPHV